MKLGVQGVSVELQARRVVHDVHLHVHAGEVVGLIGPNGSGKSTLLRSVYRMLRPASGLVALGGDDVWKLSARESARRTGVVVQEHAIDFEFTAREITLMGRTPHQGAFAGDSRRDEAIVDAALAQVGMAPLANRSFTTLSGGEKQRVLVARALAQEPKFLVLDEPTNHLDIHYQLELLELVRSLGLTTLVTLHDLNLAASYCDRLYLLREGSVVASGAPHDVLTPERLRAVFRIDTQVSRHPVNGRPLLSFSPFTPHPLEEPS